MGFLEHRMFSRPSLSGWSELARIMGQTAVANGMLPANHCLSHQKRTQHICSFSGLYVPVTAGPILERLEVIAVICFLLVSFHSCFDIVYTNFSLFNHHCLSLLSCFDIVYKFRPFSSVVQGVTLNQWTKWNILFVRGTAKV